MLSFAVYYLLKQSLRCSRAPVPSVWTRVLGPDPAIHAQRISR
jgi:hypothetical protein